MILYHGSMQVVEQPTIRPSVSGHTVDFGFGFYLTTSLEQARKWVSIKGNRLNQKIGYVSWFECPDDILLKADLRTLEFAGATPEWLAFVMDNRRNTGFVHDYDIVKGPVANDRVYTTLTLFESDVISVEEAISRLKAYVLVDQYLFHTEKALRYLSFMKSEIVNVHA